MSRVRVKICGLTRIEDMHAAVAAGADALGLVFYPQSRRAISIKEAARIVVELPALVTAVGLFVDPTAAFVAQVLEHVALDQLQFHGAESAAFCRQFGRRYIKAVPMASLDQNQAANYLEDYADACAFLFDAFGCARSGGSGERFDWCQIPASDTPRIVAGGLAPENVAEAVTRLRPFAVDVSSGVENAPGRKSSAKIKRFIDEATSVLL